jgi:hypothetical protein
VDEKRDLVDSLTSNRLARGKTLEVTLALPFREIANRFQNTDGAPRRDIRRIWNRLFKHLIPLIHSQGQDVAEPQSFRCAA